MLSKRKELHFKVNSVVESTLIHCRKKTERTKRLKEDLFQKVAGLRLGITRFLSQGKEIVQPSTWRGTDIKKKVRHRFKDTSI